ncbi:uncharacterized protein LOC116255933 [Nymphaea colorata]|nr:uncharacterized protein LOC116255933 [Nymphaea colorata]
MDGDHDDDDDDVDFFDDPNDHEHATVGLNGRYGGAKGSFNVWKPFVESTTEVSISQLWVARRYDDGNIATLEAGWMVYAHLFGDNMVRFFCLTTPDNYKTRLYNVDLRLPDHTNLVFTQVSERFFPGGALTPTSEFDGRQSEFLLEIKKDLETGNWHILFNGETMGFWLRTNYYPDFDLGDEIQWGGEIVNKRTKGRHTSTQMGNGHFGWKGLGKAAFIRHMEVYDHDLNPSDAAYPLTLYTTDSFCYDINDWGRTPMGRMITFGGPGYNAFLCS